MFQDSGNKYREVFTKHKIQLRNHTRSVKKNISSLTQLEIHLFPTHC